MAFEFRDAARAFCSAALETHLVSIFLRFSRALRFLEGRKQEVRIHAGLRRGVTTPRVGGLRHPVSGVVVKFDTGFKLFDN